ncbi:SRPBCC domain-containing protein [Kocuria sp.]|uniref:SRPBCC domain-containing protein n=1 Tax=Kocuria sp. TaxID=1871328 RepID=UPI0026DF29EF|nr:SRPBCC domain-containing protein [Kocuria sp.]MDO5618121.1 SRPBCC domain-containing protein [Kocuria sp.]
MTQEQSPVTAPVQPLVLAVVQSHEPAPDQRLLVGRDGSTVVALSRDLACDQQRAWDFLTTPAGLAAWSPCVPDRSLAETGAATMRENPTDDPVDGTVEAAQAPSYLVHQWGPERLEWHLTPTAQGTRLELIMDCTSAEMAAACGAGWHVCLAVLEVLARGEQADRVVGYDAFGYGWEAMNASYADHVERAQ